MHGMEHHLSCCSSKKTDDVPTSMQKTLQGIKYALTQLIDDLIKWIDDKIDNEYTYEHINRILNVWIKNLGGSWERMEGRPGERNDEFLVGETEVDYCTELEINGVKHFLISPNEKSGKKVDIFHSGLADRLSEEEILDIINAGKDVI